MSETHLNSTLAEALELGVTAMADELGFDGRMSWDIRREGISTELVGTPPTELVDAYPDGARGRIEAVARMLDLQPIEDDDGKHTGYAGVTGNLAVHLPLPEFQHALNRQG